MKLDIADLKALSEISPNTLAAYLRSRGWAAGRVERELGFFHKMIDGDDVEFDVPLRQNVRDYPRRVRDVLENLTIVENRSQYDIYQDLIRTNQDIVRVSIAGFELTGQIMKLETSDIALGGNVTVAGLVDDSVRQVQFFAGPDDYQRAIEAHRHKRIVSVEGELVKEGRSFRLNNPRLFSVAA